MYVCVCQYCVCLSNMFVCMYARVFVCVCMRARACVVVVGFFDFDARVYACMYVCTCNQLICFSLEFGTYAHTNTSVVHPADKVVFCCIGMYMYVNCFCIRTTVNLTCTLSLFQSRFFLRESVTVLLDLGLTLYHFAMQFVEFYRAKS